MTQEQKKETYTLKELAEAAGYTEVFLRKQIKAGKLHAGRQLGPNGSYRFVIHSGFARAWYSGRVDSQRSKVYRAEDRAHKNTEEYNNIDFNNIHEAQKFVNEVIGSSYWKKVCLGVVEKVTLESSGKRFTSTAFWHNLTIKLASTHFNKQIILHELAHILKKQNEMESGELREPGHMRTFCRAYIELVSEFLGENPVEALLTSFDEYGIKYEVTEFSPLEFNLDFI